MATHNNPPVSPDAPHGPEDPVYARNLRRAILASSVGSALEYYDFALYGLASALIFGKLFFPALGDSAALVASFATYAVGFLARPLGGLFFGILGDRLGRKTVLMSTVALMGGASTLVGVLPTGKQVGLLAPILLIVLRLLQGFGAGAEQAGATTLMAEYSPRARRGFYSALPFVGIQAGTLLAAGAFTLLGFLDRDVLLGGVWRIPFLASALLIAVALWIRLRLAESPTFVKLEKQEQVTERPLHELLQTSKRNVGIGIGLRLAENGGSYIFSTLAISFVVGMAGVSKSIGPLAVAVASLVGIFSVPFAGHLSDRFGRVPVYRAGSIVLLVLAFPGWYLLSLGNPVIVIAVIAVAIGLGVNGMLGAQCAMLPELFGNGHRYIGVAVSREFSAVFAGGAAPLVGALLLWATNHAWWPLAVYVFLLALITFATTFIAPETKARDLTSPENAGEQTFREELAESVAA
jgi:MHS family metabolite:H+ symporter-like MFS transporter